MATPPKTNQPLHPRLGVGHERRIRVSRWQGERSASLARVCQLVLDDAHKRPRVVGRRDLREELLPRHKSRDQLEMLALGGETGQNARARKTEAEDGVG